MANRQVLCAVGSAFLLIVIAVLLVFQLRPTPLPVGVIADRIVVLKAARELKLYSAGEILKTYRIALGSNPNGHKQQQGDGRTPEGTYVIDYRNPNSKYHLALHISYPNAEDRQRARKRGVSPGGDIMIHGASMNRGWLSHLRRPNDWTLGCIAVTNSEIEEIWRGVPDGTKIEINP